MHIQIYYLAYNVGLVLRYPQAQEKQSERGTDDAVCLRGTIQVVQLIPIVEILCCTHYIICFTKSSGLLFIHHMHSIYRESNIGVLKTLTD